MEDTTPVLFYALMGSAAALSFALGLLALYVNRVDVETVPADPEDPETNYWEEETP